MPLAYSGSPLCTLENSLMVGVGERRKKVSLCFGESEGWET